MQHLRRRALMLTVGIAATLSIAIGAIAGDATKTYPQHDPQFQAASLNVEPAPLPTLDPEVRDDSLTARAEYAQARHEAELEAARKHAEWHAEQERKREQEQQQAAAAPARPSGSVWDRLAQCESGGNWAYNGASGYDGGLQFHPDTWNAYKLSGYPAYAYQASRAQQIAVGERILASQGWSAWPACSRKLGLR